MATQRLSAQEVLERRKKAKESGVYKDATSSQSNTTEGRRTVQEVLERRQKAKDAGTYKAGEMRKVTSVSAQSKKDKITTESPTETIQSKYGTYEEFAEKNKDKIPGAVSDELYEKMMRDLYNGMVYQETQKQASGSDFYGLTNKTYQEYLDNIQKNATDQKQINWLNTQKSNLEILQDEDVRRLVGQMVDFGTNPENKAAYKSYEIARKEWEEKGYDVDKLQSLYDTYQREANAQKVQDMEKRVDQKTGTAWGDTKESVKSIGAALLSIGGILDDGATWLQEKITGEYNPLDTNAGSHYYGQYRDKVRGNVTQDIEGERNYSEEDKKNLEILESSEVNSLIQEMLPYYQNMENKVAYKPYMEAKSKLEELGYKSEDIYSLLRTVDTDGLSKTRKVLSDVYNAGMSVADSTAAMAVGGLGAKALGAGTGLAKGLTQGIMSLEATEGTTRDVFERTGSSGQAVLTGIASGAIEAATEKFSLDNAWDIMKGSGKAITRSSVANLLAQAGIEGSEEMVAEIANTLTDKLINREDSTFDITMQNYIDQGMSEREAFASAIKDVTGQVLEAGAMGALAGGMSGGAYLGANVVGKYYAGREAVKFDEMEQVEAKAEKYTDERVQKALKDYRENPSDYKAGKLIYEMSTVDEIKANLAKKANKGKTPSQTTENANEGQISNAQTNSESNVSKQTVESQPKAVDTSEVKARMQQATTADELVEAVREVEKNGTQEQIEEVRMYREMRGAQMVTAGITTNEELALANSRMSEEEAYEAGVRNEEVAPELLSVNGKISYKEGKMQYLRNNIANNTISNTKEVTTAEVTDQNGQVMTIKGIASAEGEPTVQTENSTVNLSDISFQNEAVGILYNNASAMGSTKGANMYLKYYPGNIMVNSYEQMVQKIMKDGELGLSLDKVLKRRTGATYWIGKEGVKEFYALGQEKTKESNRQLESVKRKGNGKLIDKRRGKTEEPLLKVLEQIAERTGLDIEVSDKEVSDVRGYFEESMSRIVLNADANMFETVLHELGEFTDSWNTEGMKQFQTALLDWYFETHDNDKMQNLIESVQNVYKQQEGSKTYREASNEIVNDAISGLFATETGTKDFTEWLGKNRTETETKSILQTIADFLKDLCDAIRTYITGHNLSGTTRSAMEMSEERAKELRQQFLDAMNKAVENYQKTEKNKNGSNKDKVYSLHVDENIKAKAEQFKREGYKNFERVKVLDVTPRINAEVKRLIGFDATGYEIYSNTDTYKHIEDRHGEKGKHDQSMKDMRDVALMGYVLEEFDSAELVLNSKGEADITNAFVDKNGKPSKMIKFSKEINGVQHVVVATPENGYKKLWVLSEYIEQKKKDTSQTSHGKQALPPTPEANPDNVSSKDSISETGENATKRSSLHENVKIAEEYFGTTYKINEAGYLLTDGKLLDFSGRHEGAQGGYRTVDHRDIIDALGEDYGGDTYTGGMIRFMQEGNIRLSPESGGINLSVKPSKAQLDTLDRYITNFRGEVTLDIDDEQGNTVVSMEYPKRTYSKRIINDINEYFDKGVIPEQPSSLGQFRYSLNDATVQAEKLFAEEYDAWDKTDFRKTFTIEGSLDALQAIGVGKKKITMDGVKILRILEKHPQMTDQIIKKIPSVVLDPVIILQSKQSDTRVVMSGELYDSENKPVAVILELEPKGKDGLVLDEVKIASAYGKNGMQNLINTSVIRYVNPDNTKTSRWLKCTRLQLPFGLTSTGSTDSITSTNSIVKDDLRYSLNDATDLSDFWFNNDNLEEPIGNAASILEEGAKLLQGKEVDVATIRKIARGMVKEYQSHYDVDTLSENLEKLFSYMQTQEKVSYDDMIRIMTEVTMPVIEESTSVDETQQEIYQNFKKKLRGMNIRLSRQQKEEVAHYYDSYENFRRKMFGTLALSESGQELDSLWLEISDMSQGFIDSIVTETDQPLRLVEALEQMKPQVVNNFGTDNHGVAMDMALRIYEEYFKVQHSAKVRSLEIKMRKDRTEWQKRERQKYQDNLREIRKRMRDKEETINERVAKVRAEYRTSELQKKYNQESAEYRYKIKKTGSELVRWIEKPTNQKHVPEQLKGLVLEFLDCIDFVSHRAKDDSQSTIRWQERMTSIHSELQKTSLAMATNELGKEQLRNFLTTLHPDFMPTLEKFIENGKTVEKISQMEYRQLKELDFLMRTMKSAVTKANEMHQNEMYRYAAEAGEATIQELAQKKERTSEMSVVEKTLSLDMAEPLTFMKRLGDGAMSIYQELRKGFDKRVELLRESKEYTEKIVKKIPKETLAKWIGDNAEIHTVETREGKIQLSTGQIMNLYLLSKRNQGKIHILKGGIKATGIGKGRKKTFQAVPKHVTEVQLGKILSILTPEQKAFADSLQGFLATRCAEWGNEVHMKMYEYKKFMDERYWPIKIIKEQLRSKGNAPNEASAYAVKNLGFTNTIQNEAPQAIEIDDIINVYVNHVTEMATYNAYLLPLTDAMKWFNYNNSGFEGEIHQYDGVRQAISAIYGKQSNEYFLDLLFEINGETDSDKMSTISNKLAGNFKKASVMSNLSVILQQPTAYIKAINVLDVKDVIGALNGIMSLRKNVNEALEHSAIAQWKAWGFYETYMGQSMKEVITGLQTKTEKMENVLSMGAQKADEYTWGILWNACKREIRRTQPSLKEGSKEFFEAVTKRFDEVIDDTQVVDSVLHKSPILKSKGFISMEMAFMSEPIKAYNMMYRAIDNLAREENGLLGKVTKATLNKKFARSVMAWMLGGMLASMAASFVYAFRDDKETPFGERYWKSFVDKLKDNLNPLNMIPYIKTAISMWQGYSAKRIDTEGIANLIYSLQGAMKKFTNPDKSTKTWYGVSKQFAKGISYLTGKPVYAVWRETESLIETFIGTDIRETETTGDLYQDLIYNETGSNTYEKAYEKLEEKGKTDKDIRSGVRSKLNSMFKAGEITEEEAKKVLRKWGYTDTGEIIRKWKENMEK